MKKILLLLTICLAYVYVDAQTIDKKLLYGKWMLYSMGGDGHTILKDSMEQNITLKINHTRIQDPGRQMTMNDSLKLASNIRKRYTDLFKSYMKFDEKGNCGMQLGTEKVENGQVIEQKGTYVWSSENTIIQTFGKSNPETFVIVILTSNKLVIKEGLQSEDEKQLVMSFIKE